MLGVVYYNPEPQTLTFPGGLTALGIMTCYFSGRPGADFFVGIAPHVALAYSTVVIATNVLCTTLISARILWIRGKNHPAGIGSVTTRTELTASMVVESMLPYTLFGVAYVATLGANSPVSILFLSLYVMFTVSLTCFTQSVFITTTDCYLVARLVPLAADDHLADAHGTWMALQHDPGLGIFTDRDEDSALLEPGAGDRGDEGDDRRPRDWAYGLTVVAKPTFRFLFLEYARRRVSRLLEANSRRL